MRGTILWMAGALGVSALEAGETFAAGFQVRGRACPAWGMEGKQETVVLARVVCGTTSVHSDCAT